MSANTTFIPESGLTTENNVNAQANVAPKRNVPGITPPAVLKEADKVNEELSALGSSIDRDENAHPIGKYHSFFYELLTWTHPRASALILATALSAIIFTRFVNVPKFAFRVLWIALLSSTSLEVAGKFVFRSDQGFVSQFAPQKYIIVDRAQLEPIFSELHSLLNFSIAESQRLLFARNVTHTSIAFVLSFVAYNLIKFLPLWGLSIIGLLLSFTLPPIYIRNQAAIDAQIRQATELSSQHYQNAKQQASKHAEVYSDKARSVAIDLGNKAGVNVNKYISGPGIQLSNTENLKKEDVSKAVKPTVEHKVDTAPIVAEMSNAPAVPAHHDGVAE